MERPLQIALLISVGIHSAVFGPLSGLPGRSEKPAETLIEVTYVDIEEELVDNRVMAEVEKVTLETETPKAPPEEKAEDQEPTAEEPIPAPPRSEAIQAEIEIPAPAEIQTIDLNTIAYYDGSSDSLEYLRSIRNKINQYVQRNYRPSMGEGKAVIHFVLDRYGFVESVSFARDKLAGNEMLKKLCLDSVRDSAPFMSFPRGLDLPRAAFNISISFSRR